LIGTITRPPTGVRWPGSAGWSCILISAGKGATAMRMALDYVHGLGGPSVRLPLKEGKLDR
jgi:hypothetical protein